MTAEQLEPLDLLPPNPVQDAIDYIASLTPSPPDWEDCREVIVERWGLDIWRKVVIAMANHMTAQE